MLYLSNCIYIIVLNATRDIFQILYSPLNVIIINESPEWSCALFMPRLDTATGTSHLVKVTHSQPPKKNDPVWLQSPGSLLQHLLWLPIDSDLPSPAPATDRQFLSLSPGKSSSLCSSSSLQLALGSHQIYSVHIPSAN